MQAAIASTALRQVAGSSDAEPCVLAAGRTSVAWMVDRAGDRWVVRVPVANSGRSVTYRSERAVTSMLYERGQPVTQWTVVEVDGLTCSVGRALSGTPIDDGWTWTPSFTSGVADLLRDLHRLPASGHGPLRQSEDRLIGGSRSAREGIVDRWRHATCWPFDQTSLSDHSVAELSPDLVSRLLPLERSIVDAADRSAVPVHSDLHRQHLLRDVAGDLTGVLDFGDAFIGSPVWDFALVRWYYGPANTTALATAYDGTDEHLVLAASHLALAVGLYKLAKSPDDSVVLDRLRVLLTSIDQVESI